MDAAGDTEQQQQQQAMMHHMHMMPLLAMPSAMGSDEEGHAGMQLAGLPALAGPAVGPGALPVEVAEAEQYEL